MTDLMETIETRTADYVAMSTSGMFVWNMRGRYIPGYTWSIQCEITGYLSPQQAKAKIEAWLTNQYKATEITFFRRTSDKATMFRANFVRGDENNA